MRIHRTGSAGALLLAAHAYALAQSTTAPAADMQRVQVSASADDKRAQSTTTAIIVGRDEILRQGDTSLADVLKRQPGITLDGAPGRPPAIRMHGMGAGYVAILLNGLPAPAGFSIESLSPDLIERIEILRATTAETSGQAVAGTINVILRRAGAGPDEVKAGGALSAGHAAPSLVAVHNGGSGGLAWTLALTARRTDNVFSGLATDVGHAPDLLRFTSYNDRQVQDLLELAPRLSWQLDPTDTLSAQAYVRKRRIDGDKLEVETGGADTAIAFPHAQSLFGSQPTNAYADLSWTRKLAAGARLTTKVSGYDTRGDADFLYLGRDTDNALIETHHVLSGIREREYAFNGSWRRPLWDSHALAVGWELGRKRRDEYRIEHQTDANSAPLLDSDEDYRAQIVHSALFVQDEWDIDSAWSAYVGLRRENLRTTDEGSANAAVEVATSIWSPIAQAMFKPQEGKDGRRNQFRIAIGRTYKAPSIAQLMPRRYTVDTENSATNPDQQGNPSLRPELSLGIDLAWERYFDRDGMVSLSAFQKRIHDITINRVYESAGRWIVTPDNQGDATVRGLEFEGKRTIGTLSARVNLARNWSHVDAVPSPANHIAGQPAYSGNLGLDYASGGALDAGGTYTIRSCIATRSSVLVEDSASVKRQLDLYASWKRGRNGKLRVSVSDLLHQAYDEGTVYLGNPIDTGALASRVAHRLHPTWRIVWEQSL